jgi:hypothetical protein
MPQSSVRNDTRRAVLLARIATAWDKRADLRLGQLLVQSIKSTNPSPIFEPTLDYLDKIDDQQLAEAIERLVLLGGGQ